MLANIIIIIMKYHNNSNSKHKFISSNISSIGRSPQTTNPLNTNKNSQTSGILTFFGFGEKGKQTAIHSRKMSSSNKIEQKTQYYSNVNSNYDTHDLHSKHLVTPKKAPGVKSYKEITSMRVIDPLKAHQRRSRPSMHFQN
jgi:hypothetical protein